MKKDSDSKVETTSRRQFTRAMVTAAVAAPIAASMASCTGGSPGPSPAPTPSAAPTTGPSTTGAESCLCQAIHRNGYTEIPFKLGELEEHIPPMDLTGGGSLIIDSSNKLKTTDTGSGPFTYVEDGVKDDNRYGVIDRVLVITELDDHPYLSVTLYKGFEDDGTKLLLWYQNISPSPEDPEDATYSTAPFPDIPDVRLVGGKGTNLFKMEVKKKFGEDKSHKAHRPHRYKHSDENGPAGHFRIGRWRLVNSANVTLAEDTGKENYTFHIAYGHYQPPL